MATEEHQEFAALLLKSLSNPNPESASPTFDANPEQSRNAANALTAIVRHRLFVNSGEQSAKQKEAKTFQWKGGVFNTRIIADRAYFWTNVRRGVSDRMHTIADNSPTAYLLACSAPGDSSVSVWAIPEPYFYECLAGLPPKENEGEFSIEIRPDRQVLEHSSRPTDFRAYSRTFRLTEPEVALLNRSREVDAVAKQNRKQSHGGELTDSSADLKLTGLEAQFHQEMIALYRRTGEATRHLARPYWPNRFRRRVTEVGGVLAAKRWLRSAANAQSGFGRLAEVNRLDLTVESVVLQPKWSSLFSAEERRIARTRLEAYGEYFFPDEAELRSTIVEGAKRSIIVNAYERSAEARRKCLAVHGHVCSICGIDFGLVYGEVAEGYIHVHHVRPLAEIGMSYIVDPVEDLRPVCPNCHAVLHIGGICRSIEEVRAMLYHSRG